MNDLPPDRQDVRLYRVGQVWWTQVTWDDDLEAKGTKVEKFVPLSRFEEEKRGREAAEASNEGLHLTREEARFLLIAADAFPVGSQGSEPLLDTADKLRAFLDREDPAKSHRSHRIKPGGGKVRERDA